MRGEASWPTAIAKRRLLVWTQSIASVLALLLGILVATGLVRLWMIPVLTFCLGTTESIDKPARAAFVVEMVGKARLVNEGAFRPATPAVLRGSGPAGARHQLLALTSVDKRAAVTTRTLS